MRLISYLLTLSLLALPGAALAASAADARLEVQRAREGVQGLRAQQTQLRGELNDAAGRIQELKARQQGRLIPAGELSGLLRRSQELSGSLTEVEAALARADGEVQQKSAALAAALDAELESARAAFDRSGREERRAVLERMRALRRERDQVRAQLPSAQLPQMKGQDTDDPEDLLEQADALRDTQDKVASRLKALDRRISELKRERELDRRMGEFLGEEQAFDERDRRLAGNSVAGLDADPRAPNEPVGLFGVLTAQPESLGAGAPRTNSPRGGQVQAQVEIGGAPAPGSDEELSALAKQRQELDAMSKELGARADELERRARTLN